MKEWIVNIKIVIPSYTSKLNVVRWKQEKCWICEECGIVYYMGWISNTEEGLKETTPGEYRRIMENCYKKDDTFKVEVLYKLK